MLRKIWTVNQNYDIEKAFGNSSKGVWERGVVTVYGVIFPCLFIMELSSHSLGNKKL